MYHNYSFLSSLKLDKGCIIIVTCWYNKCSCVHVVTVFILVISDVTLNYNYKNMLYLLKIKKTFSDWRMGYYRIVFYFPIIWIAIIVAPYFNIVKLVSSTWTQLLEYQIWSSKSNLLSFPTLSYIYFLFW